MSTTTYDKAYFIAKFEAIPEERWTVGTYGYAGRHCALGHCGYEIDGDGCDDPSDEGLSLSLLIWNALSNSPTNINDGKDPRYQQSTPRARILSALHSLP